MGFPAAGFDSKLNAANTRGPLEERLALISFHLSRTAGFLILHTSMVLPGAAGWLLLPAPQALAQPAPQALAQSAPAEAPTGAPQVIDTEAVAPLRFIAAHGRRALVAGYASGGLEVWAYPFQIVSGYRVEFRSAGATTPLRGQDILRRVTYEPDAVTRTYVGPDFVVREKLFVPLGEPGAILTYQVEGGRGVEIEVHAAPVLDLMWPAALGGQSVEWNQTLSAFVLSEPAAGNTALVGSPQIVAHDQIGNSTANGEKSSALGFTLRPDSTGTAVVVCALNPAKTADPGLLFKRLIRDRQALETVSAAHVRAFQDATLRIETPDPQTNQAIAWAETALDQAWVCNPDLGCGYVAGYGPSRGARRPQYDWFFAGDGLVAADASLDIGDSTRTRQEFEFILGYQDRKTGMIWHELSQSAGLINWVGGYPYMFVHVDITFQFLSALERYVTTTGDVAFARDHWKQIDAAYRYCRTVIDTTSGLPRIPDDKSGGDEQDRLADELDLSTSWAQAAQAFAHLATLTSHASMAEEASQASQQARASIATRYWSDKRSFWVSGYTATGAGAPERRSGPGDALTLHLFNAEQTSTLLDQLASASFQTDWGTRSVAADSPGYDPDSYAKGSVWAVGTASLAEAFWAEHRPATAQGLWRALLPWASLDSLGHMDEVLAGDFYRAQDEAVPEQTWSSAGFLDATLHGLLGITVDSLADRIGFAPRLPAAWNSVSIQHISLPNASVGLTLHRTPHGLTLVLNNAGTPFHFAFAPEIPLGSHITGAMLDRQPIAAALESHPQESDARVEFDAPPGESELHIEFLGGVSIIAESPAPQIGASSSGVRVVDVHLDGTTLTIAADIPQNRASHLQLQTDWILVKAEGADAQAAGDRLVDLTFAAAPEAAPSAPYRRVKAVVQFKP
jgi:glycogen debranching enzyme